MNKPLILSKTFDSEKTKEFKNEKEIVLNSKSKRQIFSFLNKYLVISKKDLELFRNSTLIVVPSTSGKNIIPYAFAELLKKNFDDINVLNGVGNQFIFPTNINQAKYLYTPNSRLKNVSTYSFDKINVKHSTNFILIDDFLTTGETTINLSKQLLKNCNIKVGSIASLGCNTKSYCSSNDVEYVFNLINEKRSVNESFKNNLTLFLNDYLRVKASRSVWFLKGKNENVDNFINSVNGYCKIYKENNIDYLLKSRSKSNNQIKSNRI